MALTNRHSCEFRCLVARPEGFEPPTPRFVVWCSIQLSYGRMPLDRAEERGTRA
jgi:hypothetical protein